VRFAAGSDPWRLQLRRLLQQLTAGSSADALQQMLKTRVDLKEARPMLRHCSMQQSLTSAQDGSAAWQRAQQLAPQLRCYNEALCAM
jgi:hypothetical protein